MVHLFGSIKFLGRCRNHGTEQEEIGEGNPHDRLDKQEVKRV